MSHVLDIRKVSVQPQTTELDTRMRTFDLLELGERVFGNRLRLIIALTSSRHIVLQRWQLIYSPANQASIHRLNHSFH